jgi:hypothetical protein
VGRIALLPDAIPQPALLNGNQATRATRTDRAGGMLLVGFALMLIARQGLREQHAARRAGEAAAVSARSSPR